MLLMSQSGQPQLCGLLSLMSHAKQWQTMLTEHRCLLAVRLHHCNDPDLHGLGKVRPRIHHHGKISARGLPGTRIVATCTGFCSAQIAIVRFSAEKLGVFESCIAHLRKSR